MKRHDASRHPGVQIHESAYVDEPCTIGRATKIWHFSHIMPNCTIGERCNIGQNVVISPDVTLGNNVKVQNNVSIYTGVIIEDDVFCGPSMVFTNVINPRSEVVRRDEYQQTVIRRGASIGANATVVCGTEVGRYAFIAAGAVVAKDVPAYALMLGVPARQRGWVCRCGCTLNTRTVADADTAGGAQAVRCTECRNEYELSDGMLAPVHETQETRDVQPA